MKKNFNLLYTNLIILIKFNLTIFRKGISRKSNKTALYYVDIAYRANSSN